MYLISKDRAVRTATDYALDDRIFHHSRVIFSYCHVQNKSMICQPSIKITWGVKWPQHEADQSFSFRGLVECVEFHVFRPVLCNGILLKHRYSNFDFYLCVQLHCNMIAVWNTVSISTKPYSYWLLFV
jgi:hypothetical protein